MKKAGFATRLYVSDTGCPEETFTKWYDLMPTARKARCDRLKMEADRKRCIAAYALLVHALRDAGVMCEDTLNISETSEGKPLIRDIPVKFSISHAKDRVAVALSGDEVGCDVEYRSTNALKIAKRFFTDKEFAFLDLLEDEDIRDHEFTRIWTMKESVVKCCGEGIKRPFDDFYCVDEKGETIDPVMLPGKSGAYHINEYESESGYCYSVCSRYSEFEKHLRRVSVL